MPPLNRFQIASLYRPAGPKLVNSFAATSGAQLSLANGVDLTLPIRGLRFEFLGRLTIAGADMAAVFPEGLLNLIQNIKITGSNKRQGGNVTLYDIDLATLWVMEHLFANRAGQFDIGGTDRPIPAMPFPPVGATGYIAVTQGTYDFRIVVDTPFHPFEAPVQVRPGFLVRNEEWGDSLQIAVQMATLANGAVTGPLGTGAAATTLALTAYGSAAGTPTLNIYSLPILMGDTKNLVLPGFVTRVQQPINAPLINGGNGITLLNLQKQNTSRVILKTGTTTVAPAFATLSDAIVTSMGLTLGGNRNIKNLLSTFAHDLSRKSRYDRGAIQGYKVFDFIQSGLPDSGYPGDRIGDGSTFQLVGNVTATANGFGIVVQEQMLFAPEGALYSF